MTPTPRANPLLRLTCAAGAVITTAVIGLFIHALVHHYDMAAQASATAQPVVVAQAKPR
ncbi:MAG TPA: hypothetical protein VLE94_02335 [Burkholderiaceae bacterium]|nr:hypothetical protein [Burkholderiaceae bacterium]